MTEWKSFGMVLLPGLFNVPVRNPRDEVVSQLSGPGVVVLELRQSFESRRDDRWESQTRHIVKVLEFDGEQIRRVIDYW